MTDYKQLCAELVAWAEKTSAHYYSEPGVLIRARAALAEPELQRRCIYSPVQIAECGGPCEQGPEYCDCGELCVTEPAGATIRDLQTVQTNRPSVHMTDLSPAAQAVLDAFNREARPEPHHQREAIAAALRAVAEQGATFYWWDGCPVQAVIVGSLLTIANQLEAQ